MMTASETQSALFMPGFLPQRHPHKRITLRLEVKWSARGYRHRCPALRALRDRSGAAVPSRDGTQPAGT
jgi:hypothetical protein